MNRPPKITLDAAPRVRFRLPEKAAALWDKTLKGPTDGVTISILSPIGKPWFEGDDVFSAKDLMTQLESANKKPITLNINSPGGDAFEGVTIYNLLVDYPAPITVNVLGEAASAASVIAMAGDRIRMYQGALMMIHSSSGLAIGNADDMRELADILEKLDGSVADVYAQRTGNSRETVIEMMQAETWMTPDEAVDNGFASEIVKEKKPAKSVKATASATPSQRRAAVMMSATTPGATGLKLRQGVTIMQTTNERIQALENSRAATVARMQAITKKAADEGRAFDQSEQDEFDTCDSEIITLDKQLKADKRMAELALASAAPVNMDAGTDGAAAAAARAPARSGIRVVANLEKGVPFARYAMAMTVAMGNRQVALEHVKANKRWMDQSPQVAQFLMTAVGAGTRTASGWADDLVYAQNLTQDFVDILRPMTIVGRIPGIRRAPFNIRVGTKTSGTTGYWVGEGRPIPMSKFATGVLTLDRHKLAGLTSITEELALDSSPGAELLVRDDLRDSIIQLMDESFIDPDRAEVSGISPASVTNGVTPVAATGTSAAALRTDIATLFGKFITNELPLSGGVWITTSTVAVALSMMTNALGQPEFPTVTPEGGTFLGYPVIVSQSALTTTSPTGGNLLIFALPREIYLADDGGVDISVSREASLEMSDAPTNRADNGTGASLVSMYQNDSLAVRAIRFVTWKKRRTGAVEFINDAMYAA